MKFFPPLHEKLSHFFPRIFFCLMLFFAGNWAWGAVYIFNSSGLFKYTGSETDYQAILNDTTKFETSTDYGATSTEVKAEDTIIIPQGNSLTINLSTTNGTIVNYGTINVTSELTNKGTIYNYENGKIEGSGSIVNAASGTIENAGTINSPITNNGTLKNTGTITSTITNNGTLENSGTISGSVTDNHIYYWIGSSGGAWSTSSNWSHDGSTALTSGYPGSSSGDTAVFDAASAEIKVNELSVASGVTSLFIENKSSGKRVRIIKCNANAAETSLTLTVLSGYVLFDSCEVGNLTINSGGKVQMTRNEDSTKDSILVNGNLTVDSGASLYALGNNSLKVKGESSIAGTLNLGEATGTFTGDFTSTGSFTAGSGVVYFYSDFTSTGSFTASSGNTYFSGNVDFSGARSFSANGGAICFFCDSEKTFKTCSGQAFNTLYFGGHPVIEVSKGDISAVSLRMLTPDRTSILYSVNTEAKITGGYKITCSGSTTENPGLELSRISETSGVTGNLTLDANIKTAFLYNHSGTNLTVNEGKTLTISSFSDISSSKNPNSITINGSLSAAGVSLEFSEKTDLTVGTSGTLTAASITNVSTLTNSGTISLTGGSSSLTFASYAGSDDNTDIVNCEGGTISCTASSSTGTIGKLNLTSGTTSLGYSDTSVTEVFKLGTVTIASGATLTLASDISVSGNWTNNNTSGGLDASTNEKTVTFTGEGKTISGSQTFYNAAFTGSGATLSGENAFTTATFTASTSLSGSNSYNSFVCQTGGVTLTINDSQTVTQNLTLKGTSDSKLTLSGAGAFIVPKNTSESTYHDLQNLSIGENIVIKGSSGDVEYGAYSAVNSSPSFTSDTVQDSYVTLFKHGWNLGYEFTCTWTGSSSTSWATAANWDTGIVPGDSSLNTDGVTVIIPDGCTNYPLAGSSYSLASLTIGTAANTSHGASLTISDSDSDSDSDLTLSGTLTNYGTIEYRGSGRITDGTNDINDVSNGGTVLYSGGSSTSPLELTAFTTSTDDVNYANLKITGIVSNSSPIKVSGT
ncbi:MAG: hypothetical protein K5873_10415, partial [Treponema sp.]|nr:hypothetical protein [Treponema sp.]